jgi:hypothetical protein
MLKERNVRTGFFEREQITRIVAHLPPAIRPVVGVIGPAERRCWQA